MLYFKRKSGNNLGFDPTDLTELDILRRAVKDSPKLQWLCCISADLTLILKPSFLCGFNILASNS
jgi:hypothetical protein